ncbi:MAG: hypothetical protein L6Q75_10080 [Burkholderiaceae bacterium]|nr:hypothetical protein [Burkholderiaceae bacterium]
MHQHRSGQCRQLHPQHHSRCRRFVQSGREFVRSDAVGHRPAQGGPLGGLLRKVVVQQQRTELLQLRDQPDGVQRQTGRGHHHRQMRGLPRTQQGVAQRRGLCCRQPARPGLQTSGRSTQALQAHQLERTTQAGHRLGIGPGAPAGVHHAQQFEAERRILQDPAQQHLQRLVVHATQARHPPGQAGQRG